MRYVQQVVQVGCWKKIDAMVKAAHPACAIWSLETAQGLGAPEDDLAKLQPVKHHVDVHITNARTMYANVLVNCEKAMARVPNDPWTIRMRGLAYCELREWPQARPDLEAALAACPNDVKLLAVARRVASAAETQWARAPMSSDGFRCKVSTNPSMQRSPT
jgi:tetratricopeptide (TPR) repeat protein